LKTDEDLEAAITSMNTGDHSEFDEALIGENNEEKKIDNRINKITAVRTVNRKLKNSSESNERSIRKKIL